MERANETIAWSQFFVTYNACVERNSNSWGCTVQRKLKAWRVRALTRMQNDIVSRRRTLGQPPRQRCVNNKISDAHPHHVAAYV